MVETALSLNHWQLPGNSPPFFFFNNWKFGLWVFLQDQFYMSQGFLCKMLFSLFLNSLSAHFWLPLSFKSLPFEAAGLLGAKRMTEGCEIGVGLWERLWVGSLFSSFFHFLYPFHSRTILILDSLVCIFLVCFWFCKMYVLLCVCVSRVPKWCCSLSFSFLSHFFPSLLHFISNKIAYYVYLNQNLHFFPLRFNPHTIKCTQSNFRTLLLPPKETSYSPLIPSSHCPRQPQLYLCLCGCACVGSPVNGVTQHVNLVIWLFLLPIMPSQSSVLHCISTSHGWIIFHCMEGVFIILLLSIHQLFPLFGYYEALY